MKMIIGEVVVKMEAKKLYFNNSNKMIVIKYFIIILINLIFSKILIITELV